MVNLMGTILKKIIKRLIFSFVVLYTVGIILNFLDIFVPINIYSVLVVAILGFPGVISLVMVYVFLL